MRFILTCLSLIAASSCATSESPAMPVSVAADSPAAWSFSANAPALRAASCPEGAAFEAPQSLDISATSVPLPSAGVEAEMIEGMTLAGTWHLTADDPNFGGLSGLAVQASGSLLAITDAGGWVWIGIDPATGDPDGFGAISYMRGADGNFLNGKTQADAEGLALRDGLALVSFERNHRIEAFDLEGCGAAARAAPIATLPEMIGEDAVPENKGPEALSLSDDGVLAVGFEYRNADGSPLATLMANGSLGDLTYAGQAGMYLQTALDVKGDTIARVFRAYDPIRKTRVKLHVGEATAHLKAPFPVDNFEGVAIGASPAGATRIWLISDDNFSAKQRTLLFAFDLD